jgi:hypothetical protein
MPDGRDLLRDYCKKPGGIPWFTILDGEGNELVNSTVPKGNVGCPVQDFEIAHFMEMIKQTSKDPTEENLVSIKKSLENYTAKWRQ